MSAAPSTLVVVFLRGGADGLHMVVPHAEPAYARLRPTIALSESDTRPLDARFGLHPALAPLAELYQDGALAIVHACGSDDESRSHFEAQDLMERGASLSTQPTEAASVNVSGGWAARHLRALELDPPEPLAALAMASELPECLRGAPAVALTRLDELELARRSPNRAALATALGALYGGATGAIATTGAGTLAMLDRVAGIGAAAPGSRFPDTPFAGALGQVARLLATGVGVRVASVDLGGWDTHFVQGGATGLAAGLMAELAGGLVAFAEELGPALARTCVVVMTEFGRRAYENSSLGTDHGRGSIMMVLGGGVRGGRILGEWPGLGDDSLAGPGDLAVATDYRTVLAEVLTRSLGNPRLDQVFPGFVPRPLGLFDA